MSVSIEHQLNTYIQQLNSTQKKSVLGFIKSLLRSIANEGTTTIEQYNKELDEAMAEVANGKYYTNEEVFAASKKMINGRKKS